MGETPCQAVIQTYCRELKMPHLLREYRQLARQARDAGLPHEEFLRQLLEVELTSRQQSTAQRRLREAQFPDIKSLDQLNWEALTGVSKTKLRELATCEYLSRGEDVVFAGPIGTGKTHLAISLGVEAAQRRYRVAFIRAADLVRSLIEARDDRLLGRLHQRYQRSLE